MQSEDLIIAQNHFDSLSSAELSRIFSRSNFLGLSAHIDARSYAKNIFSMHNCQKCSVELGKLFDLAWNSLRKFYRNEYVYKTEVANRIVFGRHSPSTTALYPELPAGNSIVDLAIFNGTSSAYEIKTEMDGPFRLATQYKDYVKAFDKVYLVLSERCFNKYVATVPGSVGVLLLNRRGNLKVVKEAYSNLCTLSKKNMFQCLRKHEQLAAGEKILGQKLNLPNALVYQTCMDLFESVRTVDAHQIYIDLMRARKTKPVNSSFLFSLPKSLRVIGSSISISDSKKAMVLDQLSLKT